MNYIGQRKRALPSGVFPSSIVTQWAPFPAFTLRESGVTILETHMPNT